MRQVLAAFVALLVGGCDVVPTGDTADQQAGATAVLRKPDVRYDPSPHAVVQAMLELADVDEQDIIYDLGSGDGRLPIAAARDFGARGVGIEIDPELVTRARANAAKAGVADRVTFRHEDLFEADIRDATVVTLFLYPDVNLRLRPKLLTELQPGTRVVSHYHDMGDWQPERTMRVRGRMIYFWTIPPAVPN